MDGLNTTEAMALIARAGLGWSDLPPSEGPRPNDALMERTMTAYQVLDAAIKALENDYFE